jgi:choline dehydrogenase-like flavoprotein
MHDDPKQGVVDRDLKVHTVDNLFVAGSSTFPTCGASNPTMNLVALTLRLADHLKGLFA